MPDFTRELAIAWGSEFALAAAMSLLVAWVVRGQSRLLYKIAAVTAALGPLAAATIHDYVLIQLVHLSVVAAVITAMSTVSTLHRRITDPAQIAPQFTIGQLLLVTLAVALIALELRLVYFRKLDPTPVLLEGLMNATVTLLAMFAILSQVHWAIRVVVVLLCVPALSLAIEASPTRDYVMKFYEMFPQGSVTVVPYVIGLSVSVLLAFLIHTAISRSLLDETGFTKRGTSKLKRRTITGVSGLALLAYAILAFPLWMQMALTSRVESPSQGAETSHARLVAAASRLNWESIPNQDFEAAAPEQLRRFMKMNGDTISAIRSLVSPELRATVDYDQFFTSDISLPRDAVRAVRAIAVHHERHGNLAEAARANADCIGLGVYGGSKGLVIDSLLGVIIASVGVASTFESLEDFELHTCTELSARLDAYLDAIEPLDAILMRDRRWEQTGYGWHGQAYVRAQAPERDSHFGFINARARMVTDIRLLRTHLGVRAFKLFKGHLPTTIDELIPAYIAQPLTDEFNKLRLVYKCNGDEYLLYSFGEDGKDDGGQIEPSVASPDYMLEIYALRDAEWKADEAALAAEKAIEDEAAAKEIGRIDNQ